MVADSLIQMETLHNKLYKGEESDKMEADSLRQKAHSKCTIHTYSLSLTLLPNSYSQPPPAQNLHN